MRPKTVRFVTNYNSETLPCWETVQKNWGAKPNNKKRSINSGISPTGRKQPFSWHTDETACLPVSNGCRFVICWKSGKLQLPMITLIALSWPRTVGIEFCGGTVACQAKNRVMAAAAAAISIFFTCRTQGNFDPITGTLASAQKSENLADYGNW